MPVMSVLDRRFGGRKAVISLVSIVASHVQCPEPHHELSYLRLSVLSSRLNIHHHCPRKKHKELKRKWYIPN
jgi:hypothetical protein